MRDSHSTQTLTTLNLEVNEVCAQGAQSLTESLQINNVSQIQPSIYYLHVAQALTALYLGGNRIGVEGARYLAKVLETNKVG
jgi:hypothetical protein